MRFLRRFFSDWKNWIPTLLVTVFIVIALAAPWLSPPIDPDNPEVNRVGGISSAPTPPDDDALLGTYPIGYDVFHTLVWGTRSALRLGLIATLATATIGILVGAASHFAGKTIGALGMRITDAFLAFPVLAAVIVFTQLLRPPAVFMSLNSFQQFMADLGVEPVLLGLILFSWMGYSRLTYASIGQQKKLEYVEAARVIGLGEWRIFFKHILPNIIAPLLVLVTKDIGGMVILESAFVFIGVSDYTEWGQMLVQSKNWIIGPTLGFAYWWVFIPVTLTLILFSTSWQLLGQRISATLNPRTHSFIE